MATSKIFVFPEILGIISLHLPPRNLQLSQGVNTAWKSVTTNSAALQEKLFFKVTIANHEDPNIELKWNPLIKILMEEEDQEHFPAIKGRLHLLEKAEEVTYVRASWSRMYLTRPAMRRMTARRYIGIHGNVKGGVINSEGIKLEDLFDIHSIQIRFNFPFVITDFRFGAFKETSVSLILKDCSYKPD